MAKRLTDLLAELEAIRAKGSLRRQLVHVEAWRDGKRITEPHLLIAGRLVKLTAEQITDLSEDSTNA